MDDKPGELIPAALREAGEGDVVGRDPSDPIEVSYEQNFEGEPTAISNPEMLKMQWAHGHNNSFLI